MDFLDPRRKRAHRRRLFIGYALMAVLVALGTIIVLNFANGYDFDRKTGTVIQNGIVYVDSKPGGAEIYLNDVRQGSRTDTRMALPAGAYTIRIEAEGYKKWERTFNLNGGELLRLVYPYLVPIDLTSQEVATYDTLPTFTSQSPNKRWVFIQRPGQSIQFDIYDLANASKPPVVASLPTTVITSPTLKSTVSSVDWSSDNRHLIVRRTAKGVSEYLRIDREQPQQSVNINTLLGITPVELTFRDGNPERIYFLDSIPGTLRSADIKSRSLSAPLANDVISYKSHGAEIVVYASQSKDTAEGKVDFRILENNKSYQLRAMKSSDKYVLDVSRFDDKWYYVVGTSEDGVAYVYENPLPALKQEIPSPLIVTAIMRLKQPQFVSFSESSQFIALQSGKQILTIDLFDRRQYLISLSHNIANTYQTKWMDGYRLRFVVEKQAYIIDFDGSNQQGLGVSEVAIGPFFDPDYENIYSLSVSKKTPAKSALFQTDMLIDR
ncbi:MAG: PEGA domain-containing protein [bacterium]|nr:PEGA domain-containing protein [bacterium]